MINARHGFSLSMILTALLMAGCAHTRPKPQVIIGRDGGEVQYKRHELHADRDFFHRWVRKAYRPAKDGDFDFNREEQANIIQQWGRPDYLRKSFRSLQNERVEEWIYIEYQTVMQFVDHHLVYEGPLTDFEQLLIRKGYPDEAMILIGESGIERQTLIYQNFLPGRMDTYSLANGWIVHSQEGN